MIILLLLAVSVCIGLLLQKCRCVRHIDKTATVTVWLLIFVFGISLGSNEEIIGNFARFGLTAIIVALAGVAGSLLSAWGFGRFIQK